METLSRVGTVLLDSNRAGGPIRRGLVGMDAFALGGKEVKDAIDKALSGEGGKPFEKILGLIGAPVDVNVAPENEKDGEVGALESWWTTFKVCQASEVWENHGAWVTKHRPEFGPGIKERFQMASAITTEELASASKVREAITKRLDELLSDGAVLLVPTIPGPGPIHNMPPKDLDDFRTRALNLTSIAGLARLPQVNIPIAMVDGSPVGLGLIGARGSDEALLDLAVEIAKVVPLQPSWK
jgi:amidase